MMSEAHSTFLGEMGNEFYPFLGMREDTNWYK
jgi:hypothetical protein